MTPASRHRLRASAGLAAGAAALLLASACSSSSDTGSSAGGGSTGGGGGSSLPKTLVFSPLSLAPPALKGLSEGVKGYAASKGWEVVVQDPNFDPTKQVQQLNEVIDSGRAGAAWIIAVSPPSIKDLMSTAQSKGVPLLVNGRPDEYGFSGPQPGITFDYIDYKAAGTALGDSLGKCITEKLGGNGQVLYVASKAGTAGKEEVDSSAVAALKAAAPNATVVQTTIAEDRAGAQTSTGTVLQGNPNLNAVMSSNDEGALGAIGAFSAAGKNTACVTDFGGNDEVLGLVRSGQMYASVALQFQADTTQSFDTLVKMQADPKAQGQVLIVPQKTITASSS